MSYINYLSGNGMSSIGYCLYTQQFDEAARYSLVHDEIFNM